VVIVAGKGGVGKTTVTAALARMAGLEGLATLIVELEGKSGLAALFGREPLSYREVVLRYGAEAGAAEVRGRTLTPDDALLEYLEDHGMRRLSRRLVASGALDVVATAAPGIKDILVLGKVKQLERQAAARAAGASISGGEGSRAGQPPDLLVVDAPAAGHAISFLLSARGLLDAVRAGPVNTQARDVLELLTDPARCSVLLVTLPEETPVNELVETAFNLEDRVGVSLGPVVVNGLYPRLDGLEADPVEAAGRAGVVLRDGEAEVLRAAARFRRRRHQLQAGQVARLAERLPLPQLHLPYLFRADLRPPDVDVLATALRSEVERLERSSA
jgi:anion-transporting  ArsA/GET3 family ATPase